MWVLMNLRKMLRETEKMLVTSFSFPQYFLSFQKHILIFRRIHFVVCKNLSILKGLTFLHLVKSLFPECYVRKTRFTRNEIIKAMVIFRLIWLWSDLQSSVNPLTHYNTTYFKHIHTKSFKPFPNDIWFSRPNKRRLLKTFWEKEKMLDTCIFSFPRNDSSLSQTEIIIYATKEGFWKHCGKRRNCWYWVKTFQEAWICELSPLNNWNTVDMA